MSHDEDTFGYPCVSKFRATEAHSNIKPHFKVHQDWPMNDQVIKGKFSKTRYIMEGNLCKKWSCPGVEPGLVMVNEGEGVGATEKDYFLLL